MMYDTKLTRLLLYCPTTIPQGRPDGAALYGIVLHNQGTHVMGFEMERNDSVCFDVDGENVGMVNEHEIGIGYQRCRTFEPAGNT